MVNILKLKGKIVEKGFTIESFADAVHIHRGTMYRKMGANGESFLIREMDAIVKTLELNSDEAVAIFFTQLVA